MKVKICGIRNEEDLAAAISSDADAVGFLVGQVHASADFILPSTARRLARIVPPYVVPFLVTHFTDPDTVADLVGKTGIANVQLHGGSTPEQVIDLRDRLPAGARLVLGTHFRSERDFLNVMEFYRLVDGILIDTLDEAANRVGGTGKTNDWNLAAQFVRQCPIPVILAGGLHAGNAAAAVAQVHPYALDANTGTKDRAGNTSAEYCRAFVRAARQAAMQAEFDS